jgi:hypothetical protein
MSAAGEGALVPKLAIEEAVLDRHLESHALQIALWHLNVIGAARKDDLIKDSVSAPESHTLNGPALIAAVSPYHHIAVLEEGCHVRNLSRPGVLFLAARQTSM